MKILFTVTWLAIFGLICIQPTSANTILDGTCFERCVKEFDNTYLCRLKCTDFN